MRQRAQTIGAAVKKAKSEFGAHERESIKLTENLKHLKDKEKKQRKALDKERARAGEQRSLVASAEADIAKLTKASEQEAKELAKAEQELDAIRESLKSASRSLSWARAGRHTHSLAVFSPSSLGAMDAARGTVDAVVTQEIQVELEAKQRELAPWQDKKAKVRGRAATWGIGAAAVPMQRLTHRSLAKVVRS